jgi:hypothetical protein
MLNFDKNLTMKKLLLISILVSSTVIGIFAQSGSSRSVKFGFKFSPCVSYARVIDKDDKDGIDFKRGGSSVKMVVGPYIDFGLNENVTFTTGLWYSPRSVVLSGKYTDAFGNSSTSTSQYNLQYLMVPLYFKFYTNEITSGMKIYFTLGGSFDIKLVEKKNGDDNLGLLEAAKGEGRALFNYIDASTLVGTGVEYNLKDVLTIFGGISYNRGLVNTVNPILEINGNKPYQHIAIKNNLISLDLGVKF